MPSTEWCTPRERGRNRGEFQDALSLPLSWMATFRLSGACTGSDLSAPEVVLLVTACALNEAAALPARSLSLSADSAVGAV